MSSQTHPLKAQHTGIDTLYNSLITRLAQSSFYQHLVKTTERYMVSPRFYRLSVKSFITRWYAVRRTQQVFDLMAGFVNFQVLLTCVRLGVLELLCEGPSSLEAISMKTQLSLEQLQPLLSSAIALRLIETRGPGMLGIGPLGLPVVAYDGISAMIEHNAVLYADMVNTDHLIQGKKSSQMNEFWTYAPPKSQQVAETCAQMDDMTRQEQTKKYSELMSASQNFVIDEILSAYDFGEHQILLDIGCGMGRFVANVALKHSKLRFEVMDLPAVIELTKEKLQSYQLSHRVNFNPGSFKDDPLPAGADLVSLVRVAHDHSDAVLAELFKKIYDNLPIGGALLLAEPMSSPKGARHDAYFHFYLLAMGEGKLRSAQFLGQMLLDAGFQNVKVLSNPMPIHTQILVATKT